MELEGVRQLELPTFTEDPGGRVGDTLALPPDGDTITIKKGGATERPFVLSKASPVDPAKLVKKLQRGEFIDMAKLLKDNMEVAIVAEAQLSKLKWPLWQRHT